MNVLEEIEDIIGIDNIEYGVLIVFGKKYNAILDMGQLNQNYNSKDGRFNVKGTIVVSNGDWWIREQVDGIEFWKLHRKPSLSEVMNGYRRAL